MKKLICVLLCLAMLTGLVTVFAGCSGISREELLKIYLPGEYIDESIFEDFEKWYEEQTGSKVKVQATTFEAVENILSKVEKSKEDYDLLCPSDYMVEYLIKKNLLLEVDKSIIDVEQDGLFKPDYLETARQYDPELKFSVPYMYGTLGLVYDITKTGKKVTSWESLFGNEFSGKGQRSIKDSMREAYAAACIYNARVEIAAAALNGVDAKKAKIQEVFEDTRTDTINDAYNTLKAIKEGSVWDVDNVKFDMASNIGDVAVALMWSCDAGHIMKTYEDEDGNEQAGNRNLWYVVPEEGGNVYIDNFVISAYAKNVKAADYFLQFLCRKDIAIRNSEYAGCISPIVEAYDELYTSYDEDEDGMFEGVSAEWKAMFMDVMFPSIETLNRCGIMKDFGDGQSAVVDMWSNIRA